MCIGMPMQVTATEPGHAWCEGRGERRRVNTALVGAVVAGDWVLVFLGDAREHIDADRAAEVNAALDLVLSELGICDVEVVFLCILFGRDDADEVSNELLHIRLHLARKVLGGVQIPRGELLRLLEIQVGQVRLDGGRQLRQRRLDRAHERLGVRGR